MSDAAWTPVAALADFAASDAIASSPRARRSRSTSSTAPSSRPRTAARTATRACATAGSRVTRSSARCTRDASTSAAAPRPARRPRSRWPRTRHGSPAIASSCSSVDRVAIVRVPDESADASRHHQPARHRSLQAHDVAGDAASPSGDAGRVHLPLPQHAGVSARRARPRAQPRARRALRAELPARRARLPALASLHPLRLRRLPAHLPLPARLHQRPRSAPTAAAWRSSPAARRCT